MGYQRCKGTDCTKFARQKKLVNQHQKGLGIDLLTLCTPCAQTLYTGFVGLVCSFAGCMTAPQGGKHGPFCKRHSPLECEHADCTTAPQGGAFGPFCKTHSTYIPDPKPIILVEETAESVEKLKAAAIYNLDKGKYVYAGLMGTSGLEEIDRDTLHIIKADSTLEKDSHLAIYVDGHDGQSAHDVARDAERVLIDSIGVERLLNERRGGAGRPPLDTSVGGIFIIVFKEQKKRKALDDISNNH